jgi:hypothetical protein
MSEFGAPGATPERDFSDIDFSNPGNWIALSRDVLSHPVVGAGQPVKPREPSRSAYSRCEAWIDLLCLAQYKPARINNKGEVVTLLVGQLMGARSYLAGRWNWSEDAVRWYLKTLENHGMISRQSLDNSENHTQQAPSKRNNQCNVLTISNYNKYQFINDAIESYIETLKHPPHPQRAPSQHPESNKETRKQVKNLPLPPHGVGGALVTPSANMIVQAVPEGHAPPPTQAKKSKFKAHELVISDEAFRQYNDTAKRLGFSMVASFTDARRTRLLKRLADIARPGEPNGLLAFQTALAVIEHVPFLMGKTAPKPGQAPFRLDFERLLQSSGDGLGDVLARLLDKAAQVATADGHVAPAPRNGKAWGWWSGQEAKLRSMSLESWRRVDESAKPNGTWPWDIMGPPPGHPDCLLPKELIVEKGYLEIYQGNIHHV